MTTMQPQPRLDKRALFEALNYEPHSGQVLVHRSKASRRVLACGVRWGKSQCAAMECVAALMEPRESVGWVVAPSYSVTTRVFDRVVRAIRSGMAHRIHELSEREHCLVVRNTAGGLSQLWAKSGDNPSSLLGEGLDFAVLDEAAVLKPTIWREHIAQRLLDRHGWALMISTPRGTNWFYEEFQRARRGDVDYESWSSPSWSNPYLDRELIEAECARLDKETFDELYGGEFRIENKPLCSVCNYPHRTSRTVLSFWLKSLLPKPCVTCGNMADATGHTLFNTGLNGRPTYLSIDYSVPDESLNEEERAQRMRWSNWQVPVWGERSRDSAAVERGW